MVRSLSVLLLGLVSAVTGLTQKPFQSVTSCLPFTISVNEGPHALHVSGGLPGDAIRVSVSDNELSLSMKDGKYDLTEPARIEVTVPAGQLKQLASLGTGSALLGRSVASPKALSLISRGTGSIKAAHVRTDTLTVRSDGMATILADGELKDVKVHASGTGDTYVLGHSGLADVQARGIGVVAFDPSSPRATIAGNVQGMTTVRYTRGDCHISSPFHMPPMQAGPFRMGAAASIGGGCRQVEALRRPEIDTRWSCGMRVDARRTGHCSAAVPIGGRDASLGGFSQSSSSSSSSVGGVVTTTSSFGAGGEASGVAVASIPCRCRGDKCPDADQDKEEPAVI